MAIHGLTYVIYVAGERLTDGEVDQIFKLTQTEEDLDGNVKYEGTRIAI